MSSVLLAEDEFLIRAVLVDALGDIGIACIEAPTGQAALDVVTGTAPLSAIIVDIGLRMLTPRELYRAQGFPESYAIDTGADGRPLTKTAQVRMCGNSVSPPQAAALVRANFAHERQIYRRAAA